MCLKLWVAWCMVHSLELLLQEDDALTELIDLLTRRHLNILQLLIQSKVVLVNMKSLESIDMKLTWFKLWISAMRF